LASLQPAPPFSNIVPIDSPLQVTIKTIFTSNSKGKPSENFIFLVRFIGIGLSNFLKKNNKNKRKQWVKMKRKSNFTF
jgi:hypothetical protein